MGTTRGGRGERDPEPIAILSDIHGNWRALDAVLADAGRRGIRRQVNLGDCLYGPFDPRRAADRLLELDLPTVSGNEDRILTEGEAGEPVSRTARFTIDGLSRRHLDWVAALPRIARQNGVAFFHGTPADDSMYLLTRPEDGRLAPRPAGDVARRLGEVREPVVLCGHDHTPAIVRLDDGRTIVNPGSVGCPAYEDGAPEAHVVEAGSPDARYAVVAWDGDGLRVELVSVPYDADAAADEAARNGFPDWACWVRTGRVAVR
ncbi:MAG: metallophosphoesterase family protein [Candidatus Bipolaricaulis sp.]|nr:metallophosphoesterase family protein [Candidatus Bipolaricaulis sp.]